MVWYGMVWYGMVWYGMVWYGMVWYGMVWYINSLIPVSQICPVYPTPHVHVKPLTTSMHVPPFRQGFDAHSLMSVK